MDKTLRVSETTYQMVMVAVGQAQAEKKRKVSADEVIKEHFLVGKLRFKKDPKAWEKLEKLIFKGPKDIDCLDVDIYQ
ncbi:hypothetical protein J4450_05860 [Candidatus Micrarchaeota archaeon]|nr:hypothetical protein [Candidatus Micrarchaeota archaeon]